MSLLPETVCVVPNDTAVTGLTRVSARKNVQHEVITKMTSLSKDNVHTKGHCAHKARRG